MRSIYSLLFLLITLGLSSCSEKKPTLREQSFDEEWLFYRGDIVEGERSDLDDTQWRQVNLPHDWSIEDIPGTNSPFTADAVTEVSGGFTVGGTGWYRKHFYVDAAEKGRCIAVAFQAALYIFLQRIPLSRATANSRAAAFWIRVFPMVNLIVNHHALRKLAS